MKRSTIIGIALLTPIILFRLVYNGYHIPQNGMAPTLKKNVRFFANKYAKPGKGKIAVFKFPSNRIGHEDHSGHIFVYRIVATEGDSVAIDNNNLFINNLKIDEPYKIETSTFIKRGILKGEINKFQKYWNQGNTSDYLSNLRDNFGPVTVPKGHIFVLGDNRDHSEDSRFWGPIPVDNIIAKVSFSLSLTEGLEVH